MQRICVLTHNDLSPQARTLANELGVDIVRGSTADVAIDSGYDLLICADETEPLPALTLIAAFGKVDASVVMPPLDNANEWMTLTASIRDAMRPLRANLGDVDSVLAQVGANTITATHDDLLVAAKREVPVLINGVAALAAAVSAERGAHAARRWWMVADEGTHPARAIAMQRTNLKSLTSFNLEDAHVGALLTVPVIRAAFGDETFGD